MVSLGGLLWYQTKVSVQDMYAGLQCRAAGMYQNLRRRASYVYEDLQVKAGDTYHVVHGRTTETCQRWLSSVNLVYIHCQLRVSLALHRCQFQLSSFYRDVKTRFGHNYQSHVGFHLKDAQKKVTLMHKWTKIKVMKWKKAAAQVAKVNLERLSVKAWEYEDALDERLHRLSPPPSDDKPEQRDGRQVTLTSYHHLSCSNYI